MPLYEYESAEDGEIITLLRSMADADSPVEDPSGRDRTFRRRHSVFGVGSGEGSSVAPEAPPALARCCLSQVLRSCDPAIHSA